MISAYLVVGLVLQSRGVGLRMRVIFRNFVKAYSINTVTALS